MKTLHTYKKENIVEKKANMTKATCYLFLKAVYLNNYTLIRIQFTVCNALSINYYENDDDLKRNYDRGMSSVAQCKE